MTVTTEKLYLAINRLDEKIEKSLNRVHDKMETQGRDIAVIREHLKAQNGRIKKNEDRIDSLNETTIGNKIKLAGYSTAISILVALATVVASTKSLGLW